MLETISKLLAIFLRASIGRVGAREKAGRTEPARRTAGSRAVLALAWPPAFTTLQGEVAQRTTASPLGSFALPRPINAAGCFRTRTSSPPQSPSLLLQLRAERRREDELVHPGRTRPERPQQRRLARLRTRHAQQKGAAAQQHTHCM